MIDRRAFLAAGASLPLAASALAQIRPAHQNHLPVRGRRGGDTLCRLIAEHLRPLLDRTVIVENRTGGTA